MLSYFLLYDLRHAGSGGGGPAPYQFANVTFLLEMAGGWPMINCTDGDPERTLSLSFRGLMQPGCSSNLVSGEAMASV